MNRKPYNANTDCKDGERMSGNKMKDLVDLETVHIDQSLPQEEKIRSYVEQIKNPYHFRVGKKEVRVSYSDTGDTLDDCFERMLSSISPV